MSEYSTFLKVGTTCFVLAMVEDKFIDEDFLFANSVQAMKEISHDLTLSRPIQRTNGKSITALEVQTYLYEKAKDYAEKGGLQYVGGEVGNRILEMWQEVLIGLESDLDSLHTKIDWISKKRLLDSFKDRHDLSYFDARTRYLAVQYHDLREEFSIFSKLGMESINDVNEIEDGVLNPPSGTRAYFRGKCLQKWPDQIISANWDSIVFKLDETTIRRIPVLDPVKGTKDDVENLITESETPHELIHSLGI
tara:strand:- start:7795 stop:8544 length:750 start_codon:yes stop_codon:yes gene_type:complete